MRWIPGTLYMLQLLGSHNFIPSVFSPGFPGPSFPRKWLRCGSRPHQRVCEVVTPPAPTRTTQQRGLLSFISQLVTRQRNLCDGLVGFEGGGKSLSVLKTAACETCPGRRISASYQLRSVFGLLKASCISYFHAYLLRAPNSSRLQVWNCWIDPLDVDVLDGPPKSSRSTQQALTPSSPTGLPLR